MKSITIIDERLNQIYSFEYVFQFIEFIQVNKLINKLIFTEESNDFCQFKITK